jgi:uncharacterized membrane protein YfcA
MELGLDTLGLLALAAFVSGVIDAVAGGGGLITVPALLLAGFDPATAVATNKLQGSFGTGSAAFAFLRAGRIDWRGTWPMALVAGAASVIGALSVNALSPRILAALVPVLLIMSALYFGLSPKMRDDDAHRRLSPLAFTVVIVPLIGFYDGFFGPGAGSFYLLSAVVLLGFGVLRATGQTKFLNFASNLASLGFFAWHGSVVWVAGFAMGAASLIGAQIGSRLVLRHGAGLVRPALVAMCTIVAIKLLSDPANSLHRLAADLLN